MSEPAAAPHAAELVEVARIAEPVPDATVSIEDLVLRRARGIAGVLGADVRTAHEDLADLSGAELAYVRERRDWTVDDVDDLDRDARERPPHTQSGAMHGRRIRFCQRLGAGHLGRGQRLGGAVVRVDLAAVRDHLAQRAD